MLYLNPLELILPAWPQNSQSLLCSLSLCVGINAHSAVCWLKVSMRTVLWGEAHVSTCLACFLLCMFVSLTAPLSVFNCVVSRPACCSCFDWEFTKHDETFYWKHFFKTFMNEATVNKEVLKVFDLSSVILQSFRPPPVSWHEGNRDSSSSSSFLHAGETACSSSSQALPSLSSLSVNQRW